MSNTTFNIINHAMKIINCYPDVLNKNFLAVSYWHAFADKLELCISL